MGLVLQVCCICFITVGIFSLFTLLFHLSYSVTSSEKVDKAQRYADFTLLSVPYPGKDNSFNPNLRLHSSSLLKYSPFY